MTVAGDKEAGLERTYWVSCRYRAPLVEYVERREDLAADEYESESEEEGEC